MLDTSTAAIEIAQSSQKKIDAVVQEPENLESQYKQALKQLDGLEVYNQYNRAGVVLEKGFAAGVVEWSAEKYRLLSQAWMLAHENTKAIQALTKAVALSTDGELDARLAQSHASLDQWEKAIESARSALHKGVDDEGDMQILIGNAYFELQRLDEAKAAFQAARQSPGSRETAARWISYIEDEEARLRSLQVPPQ